MSFMFIVKEGMSEKEAFEAAIKERADRKQKQKEAALSQLDQNKEYTGEVDNYGNPIYNGSLIALYSGCEGYWKVFKGENGEWLKKSVNIPEEHSTTESMMMSMSHGQVIESIEAFEEENWEMFAYLPEVCGECSHKKQCYDENSFDNCKTGALDNTNNELELDEQLQNAGYNKHDIDLAMDFIKRAKERDD